MIFYVIAVIVILVLILLNKIKDLFTPVKIAVMAIILIVLAGGANCLKYYLATKDFQSFNLAELKRQELVIQTIDFKKFIVQGTEVPKDTATSKFTDEVSVYFVSGRAEISFTDIENLEENKEDSDMVKKILRLNYNNPQKQIPFAINIIVNENDIYKVTSMESEPVNILGFKKDLITPDMSQAEIVENVKQELQKEFERQIFEGANPKKLEDSDIYQTFLKRITEIIRGLSHWESVEIKFMNQKL